MEAGLKQKENPGCCKMSDVLKDIKKLCSKADQSCQKDIHFQRVVSLVKQTPHANVFQEELASLCLQQCELALSSRDQRQYGMWLKAGTDITEKSFISVTDYLRSAEMLYLKAVVHLKWPEKEASWSGRSTQVDALASEIGLLTLKDSSEAFKTPCVPRRTFAIRGRMPQLVENIEESPSEEGNDASTITSQMITQALSEIKIGKKAPVQPLNGIDNFKTRLDMLSEEEADEVEEAEVPSKKSVVKSIEPAAKLSKESGVSKSKRLAVAKARSTRPARSSARGAAGKAPSTQRGRVQKEELGGEEVPDESTEDGKLSLNSSSATARGRRPAASSAAKNRLMRPVRKGVTGAAEEDSKASKQSTAKKATRRGAKTVYDFPIGEDTPEKRTTKRRGRSKARSSATIELPRSDSAGATKSARTAHKRVAFKRNVRTHSENKENEKQKEEECEESSQNLLAFEGMAILS